jgi:hypothetical protein
VKAKKATSGFLTLVLLAGLVVTGLTPANAALRVPKAPFKACSEVADASLYCIESVTITNVDGRKIQLTYVASGQDVPAVTEAANDLYPVARLRSGVVEVNDWWMDRYQLETWVNPNLKAMDVSSLVGTTNHPEWGAFLDPLTNTFDITVPAEAWDQTQKCYINGAITDAPRRDCQKGSIVGLIENKVVMMWSGPDAAWAAREVSNIKASTYVEYTELAKTKLQPARGATYNSTTKTFSKTETLVIPSWAKAIALKNGWNLPGSDPVLSASTGTSGEALGATPTLVDTQTSTPAQVEAGRALPGRWTTADWTKFGLDSLGYDGLYVEAKAANEFVNHLFVDGLPTLTGGDKKVSLASQIGSKGYAANLDPDITISVTVRSGDIRTGVIMASAIDVETDTRYFGGYSTITITGSPVTVPLAKSVKDCTTEDSVAKANVRQFQATIIVQNDTSGFGVEGTSGDMYVGTNGVCEGSTPVWNEQTKEFTWTAAAPHFAADGKTVNKGFYKAVIPVNDAKLLWGMTNPNDAATALRVSVTTETGGSTAAISVIAVRNGKIIIDVSNFDYSRKKLTIALKKGYKPSLAAKKTTITCVLGKTTKKITAVKPNCPKGYLRKR